MNRNFFLIVLLLIFCNLSAAAQLTYKFTGTWQGILNVGVELRIVFHIKANAKGELITTADSPDQSAYGLKCDTTIIKDKDVTIEMTNLHASYTGKLLNDSTIEGTFLQKAAIPLTLKKTEKTTVRNRPQTPQPPFPYKSEDVEYYNSDNSLKYGATITIPEGDGPFPAAVMITGSGPQDRNEDIFGHKIFAVIADHLTKKGFIVLRTDDRGVGKSTGIFNDASSKDFSKDVNVSINYLLSRPEVDKKKIGLIGHSEGGMIAPMIAVERKDIDFIILLAGPGVNIVDLMAEQNEAIAKSAGISVAASREVKPLFKILATAIPAARDSLTAAATAKDLIESWAMNKSAGILKELNLESAKQRTEYVIAMVKELRSLWFRYFITFNPGYYLEQLHCKVLALNGDKDIQVASKQNLPGIKASLKKSKSKVYEIKELPGLNHLFQTCTKCNLNEYGELEETFSPVALQAISDWLEKNVKQKIH